MLRYFGATNVRILDGGLKKWKAEGRPVVGGDQQKLGTVQPNDKGDYNYAVVNESLAIREVSKIHDIARFLHLSSNHDLEQIIDSRSNDRFLGDHPDNRPGVRSGNIKNSINIPGTSLVNPDGTLKSTEEMAAIFKRSNVNLNAELVSMCDNGITACVVDLGLRLNGAKNTKIYDGSWAEYGSIPEPDFER